MCRDGVSVWMRVGHTYADINVEWEIFPANEECWELLTRYKMKCE